MNASARAGLATGALRRSSGFGKLIAAAAENRCCAADHQGEPPMACSMCSGFGKISCPKCGGTGQLPDGGSYKTCFMCGGSGQATCPRCGGTGDDKGKSAQAGDAGGSPPS
jgi:hypothetical protein